MITTSASRAETVSPGCQDALTPTLQVRIAMAISRVLEKPADKNLHDETDRLDRHLAAHVFELVSKLTVERQAVFMRIFESAELGYTTKENTNDPSALKNAFAAIQTNPMEGLTVRVDREIARTPMGRVVLLHELVHLSRYVTSKDRAVDLHVNANRMLNRRLGVYREELTAFKEQYRFLRRVYGQEDVQRLKDLFKSGYSQSAKYLVEHGFISQEQSRLEAGQVTVILPPDDALSTPTKDSLKVLSEALYHDIFVANLERALIKSESDYIKYYVDKGYRTEQRKSARKVWWRL